MIIMAKMRMKMSRKQPIRYEPHPLKMRQSGVLKALCYGC